jgi:hypothetical protein
MLPLVFHPATTGALWHLRLLAWVEQSPGARNFHRVQRVGRLRWSGAGRTRSDSRTSIGLSPVDIHDDRKTRQHPTLPTDPTMRFRPIAAFCSKVADGKRVNLMGREDCLAQSWPQDARICGPPRTAPKSWWSVQSRGSFSPRQRLLFSSPVPSEDFLTESSASVSSESGV